MKVTAEAILARWRLAAIAVVLLAAGGVKGLELTHNRGYEPLQPIAFSHKVHAGQLGLDCLYCHTNAEKSRHATVPPMETCMGCHSVVRTDRPEVQKLAKFYEDGEPVPWVRIHSLPDHVYFPHSAHVNAGVACQTCHGPIQEMEVVKQWVDTSMGWCMKCHRSDEYLRTPESLARAQEQGEFAHSYYRTGGPARTDATALRKEYASVKDAFWNGEQLQEVAETESPEELHAAIVETLGYDSFARQQGDRGAVADHVKAFQNAPINCNTCHY
ncbi:MAG: hypothetical protein PWP23_2451 [Candidatus Sumerlaeota bacterium]|nr:hypothetical protein [Candidatus Sumerlaeota bacterium]